MTLSSFRFLLSLSTRDNALLFVGYDIIDCVVLQIQVKVNLDIRGAVPFLFLLWAFLSFLAFILFLSISVFVTLVVGHFSNLANLLPLAIFFCLALVARLGFFFPFFI